MKFFIAVFVISQLLVSKPLPIKNTAFEINHFTMVKDSTMGKNCLITVDHTNEKYRINRIFSGEEAETMVSIPRTDGPIRPCFINGDYFWYATDQLYRINFTNFVVDSINLKNKRYYQVRLIRDREKEFLLCSNDLEISLFDGGDYQEIKSILREKSVSYDKTDYREGKLLFRTAPDKLVLYDLADSRVRWQLKTESQPAYFMGINMGSSDDLFTDYKFSKAGEVFAVTFSGCLYRIEMNSGKILAQKTRFQGEVNNAGLMANIDLIDMNGDMVLDLVGPSVDYHIYCIDGRDFSVIWKYNTGYETQLPLSFFDINKDNIPDVFGVNDEMKLSIVDGKSGKALYRRLIQEGITRGKNQTKVVLADYNGNRCLDLICRASTRDLMVLEFPDLTVDQYALIWVPR